MLLTLKLLALVDANQHVSCSWTTTGHMLISKLMQICCGSCLWTTLGDATHVKVGTNLLCQVVMNHFG